MRLGSCFFISNVLDEMRLGSITFSGNHASTTAYLAQYREMVNRVEMAAQSRLWIGKDYNNFVLKDLTHLDDPFEGNFCNFFVKFLKAGIFLCVTCLVS